MNTILKILTSEWFLVIVCLILFLDLVGIVLIIIKSFNWEYIPLYLTSFIVAALMLLIAGESLYTKIKMGMGMGG